MFNPVQLVMVASDLLGDILTHTYSIEGSYPNDEAQLEEYVSSIHPTGSDVWATFFSYFIEVESETGGPRVTREVKYVVVTTCDNTFLPS